MKKIPVRFFDIEWETDGETVYLPKEVTLEIDSDIDLSDAGANALSDEFGWLVNGFQFEIL